MQPYVSALVAGTWQRNGSYCYWPNTQIELFGI